MRSEGETRHLSASRLSAQSASVFTLPPLNTRTGEPGCARKAACPSATWLADYRRRGILGMRRSFVRLALACVLGFSVALALAGAARAQAFWNEGPWVSSWPGPNGSRCFAGTWNRSGPYNSQMSLQAQICIGGAYPYAYGAAPWAGGYPTYPGAPSPNLFNTGYGPPNVQRIPYAYPFPPPPWGYTPW